jgi:hypothetical protein
VAVEIGKLEGNFPPAKQNLPVEIPPEDLAPDEPPPVSLLDGQQYVVTGASFPDEGEHHLQVWLWDVEEPTLIYTDELVCEEIPDAAEFMPLLIEWIFSHVPPPETEEEEDDEADSSPVTIALPPLPPEETAPAPKGERAQGPVFEDEDKWFYLGFRLGESNRLYTANTSSTFKSGPGPSAADWSLSKESRLAFTFEGGIQASTQLLPFLALQLEAIFTMDSASFTVPKSGNDDIWTYSSMSLMLPILAKITFRPIPFLIAPFGGAYYNLPLSDLEIVPPGTASEKVRYITEPAIGIIVGLNLGMKTSYINKGLPGLIFLDIRYAQDLGDIKYTDPYNSSVNVSSMPYFRRHMVSFTLGYEFGLVNRDVKSTLR